MEDEKMDIDGNPHGKEYLSLEMLPKPVLENIASLVKRRDRRSLSLTCRRFNNLLAGSSPRLDMRYLVVIEICPADYSKRHRLIVEVTCVEEFPGKRHTPLEITKYFKGLDKIEKCREYIRHCSLEYAIHRITWNNFACAHEIVRLNKMIKMVPAEVCDDLRFVYPYFTTHLHPRSSKPYSLEALDLFLNTPNFTTLLFNCDSESFPSASQLEEYTAVVKEWCMENGQAMVSTYGFAYTGFCKRTVNGKTTMVVAIDPPEEIIDGKYSSRASIRRIYRGINNENGPDKWYSGPLRVILQKLV